LTAEHSLTVFVGTAPAKDVDLDGFHVEQRNEIIKRSLVARHPYMLAEGRSLASLTLVMLEPALRTIALATKGFMPPDEGDALYEAALAAGASAPGLAMVEVGSYCGRSTVWLGAAARACGVTLYAVDHHGGSLENQPGWEWHDKEVVNASGRIDTLPFFRATIERAGLRHAVQECVGDSHEIGRSWREPLALCFIDGGHARDVARGDYEAWSAHVAPGGSLVIHDVFESSEDGGQAPYEEIYLAALSSRRFVETSRQGSLRVLQRQPVSGG
jgi:predicted O-methyltransferase YrrM